MTQLALYTAVFVAAAVPMLEVWLAVPAGIAAGLPFLPTALVAIVGNFLTVSLVVLAGDRLRKWWANRRRQPATETPSAEATEDRRSARLGRIIERFGVPGLAILAPFVIGSHFGAIGAVATGARKTSILWWFLVSLVLQAFIMGSLASLGIASFADESALPWS